jgi:peroxiredoxin
VLKFIRISQGGFAMPRVELNTKAPDFTLNDIHGKSVSLTDYAGKKNVLVVFNRGFL